MGLNPSSACVYLVTLGKLVHFSVPASHIPDREWTHEDHEIIQAYNLLPEALGQMGFRFQNFCYFIKIIWRVYHMLVNTGSRSCGSSL